MGKILSFIALLSMVSCVRSLNVMTNDLKKSMSEEEVKGIMGAVSEKKLYFDKKILVYYVHSSVFDIVFSKSFPYVGPFPFNRTGKEFWVVMENNVVIAFGYAGDFGGRLMNLLRE